jgi:hypothetical protein
MIPDLLVHMARKQYRTGLADGFYPGRKVDPITKDLTVFGVNLANMDPHSHRDFRRFQKCFLKLKCTLDRIRRTVKNAETAITIILLDFTALCRYTLLQYLMVTTHSCHSHGFVPLHHSGVPGNIGEHDRGKASI